MSWRELMGVNREIPPQNPQKSNFENIEDNSARVSDQDIPPAEPPSERNRWLGKIRKPLLLRRCGSLACRSCKVHSPSSHKGGCESLRFEPCRSRWFWLSPQGAIKCIACAPPDDLGLIEAWVLARDVSQGTDGFVPSEVLSLLANSGSA
jgi:hypothetical protein